MRHHLLLVVVHEGSTTTAHRECMQLLWNLLEQRLKVHRTKLNGRWQWLHRFPKEVVGSLLLLRGWTLIAQNGHCVAVHYALTAQTSQAKVDFAVLLLLLLLPFVELLYQQLVIVVPVHMKGIRRLFGRFC